MHVDQLIWNRASGGRNGSRRQRAPGLVLFFGARQALAVPDRYAELRAMFPSALLLGCSTSGQIRNGDVSDDDLIALALTFSSTPLRLVCEQVDRHTGSRACGAAIGSRLAAPDLAGVFVLSDGLCVNGSELAAGIQETVGGKVSVSGGLAGDGTDFCETLVSADCLPQSRLVAAVGFYGPAIRIGCGHAGGWTEFGPHRRITRAEDNVLFEFDGEPALDLYNRYLGEEARDLPGAGLRYPIRVFNPADPDRNFVRSIMSVDRTTGAIAFAGNVPEGWTAQLMRGSFESLAAGAAQAMRDACDALPAATAGDRLAIMTSCVGRRTLMGQHITRELEAASGGVQPGLTRAGFYSYGEFSPHRRSGVCELHNQTMAVTTLTEVNRD